MEDKKFYEICLDVEKRELKSINKEIKRIRENLRIDKIELKLAMQEKRKFLDNIKRYKEALKELEDEKQGSIK